MKRIALLILSCLLAVSAFAGCGKNGGPKLVDPGDEYEVNIDMTDEDYNQTATLKIGITADPAERELITAAAQGFKLLFPNVTVTSEIISGNDYASAVVGRYQAKNMPDIFYTSESESFRFISSKLYLNLKPYIKAQVAQDEHYLDQFVTSAMKLGQKDYDGDQYFIPRSSDRIVVHLNNKYIRPALEAADRPEKSVDVNTVRNGWTWEEFLKVLANLRAYYDKKGWTAASGRYIVDASLGWDPVLFSLFRSMGASFCDDNGNWTLDTPEMRAGMDLIRDLVEKEYIARYNAGGANYENGSGAMLIHSSSAISKYAKYISESDGGEYDLVTFPIINGTQGVTGYGVPGYGIYAGIDESKRDLAWQFMSYLMSYDGQNALAAAGMNTPSIRTDLQDYNTAQWGEGYRQYNLAATNYEPERNYSETFFLHYPATQKNDLINAVKKFVNNIMDYDTGLNALMTNDKCITDAVSALKKAAVVK